jgi:hypothetical protein
MLKKYVRLVTPASLALALGLGGCDGSDWKMCDDGSRVDPALPCTAENIAGKLLGSWQAGDGADAQRLRFEDRGQLVISGPGAESQGTFQLLGQNLSVEFGATFNEEKMEQRSQRRTQAFYLSRDGQTLAWPALARRAGKTTSGAEGEWVTWITEEKLKNGVVDKDDPGATTKREAVIVLGADKAASYSVKQGDAAQEEKGTYEPIDGQPGGYLLKLNRDPGNGAPPEQRDLKVRLIDDAVLSAVVFDRVAPAR